MGLKDILARQIQKPSGLIGNLLARSQLSHQHQYLEAFCVDLLQPQPTDLILEVGFGNGYMINKIAPALSNGHIYGIDHSEVMVRHASSRNEKYITKGTVDLQQGNLSSLPFSNNFFSKAVSNNTIYFWRNPLQEAKELLRVLQPGGLLVIGFRTGEQLWEWSIARKTDVFQHYDPDELEQLLQEAGFHTLGLEHKQELNGTFDSFAFLATKPR